MQFVTLDFLSYSLIAIDLRSIRVKNWGQALAWWLRHFVTNRKVAGSRPNEVNGFFSMYLILPAAIRPGVYSATDRNEYQKQKNNICGD
jgi:hypothetical protein